MFDVARLLADLGGPASVARDLIAEGHKVSRVTVYAWSYRGSIPGRWLAALSVLAEKKGFELRIVSYTRVDTMQTT